MKELSIFVDEAGVLGPYKVNDPYYILSFVFHNQEIDLSNELIHLEESFSNLGFKAQSFHAGPIIRREEEYRDVDREVRKKLFMIMISFLRRAPIQCKTIYLEKKHLEDDTELVDRLSVELQRFLLNLRKVIYRNTCYDRLFILSQYNISTTYIIKKENQCK